MYKKNAESERNIRLGFFSDTFTNKRNFGELMNQNEKNFSEKVDEVVSINDEFIGFSKKYYRNIFLSFLFIIVPSFLHLAYADNIIATIFITILFTSLTIVFWIITFETNQRISMGIISSQIKVIGDKHY